MTLRSGDKGNAFGPLAGGVDAIEGDFGDGGASTICRSYAGRREHERGLPVIRDIPTDRLQIFDRYKGRGIKEVDDAGWLVTFMHYDPGDIDLEKRTLQTIDNPFGTRLSPMS